MLTHSEYHASRPIPVGGTIFAAMSFPDEFTPPAENIRPHILDMGDTYQAKPSESKRVNNFVANMSKARVDRFLPVMIGKGAMGIHDITTAVTLAGATKTSHQSARTQLERLIVDGFVGKVRGFNGSVKFQWIDESVVMTITDVVISQYRSAMFGKGLISANQVNLTIKKATQSVNTYLNKLEARNFVEKVEKAGAIRRNEVRFLWRWIGK